MIASLPIREVTVFGDRAEVVRRGELRVDAGVQEVVVEDLPASLVEGTVRAGARSTVSVRLLSTDVRTVFLEESQNPEVLRLTVQLEELEAETVARARRRDAINLRRSFLASLSNQGGRAVARALAHGEADVTAATAIAGLLSAQSEELDGQEAQLDAQEREAAKQRDALGRRIAAIGEAGATRRRQVAVGMEMTGPGDVELEVRYNVLRCRWAPIYDIRLTSADGPTDLRLTYLAEVTQSTGEDWGGVALLLSTARTTGGTQVPELEPWLLQPYQPPRAMMSAAGAPMGAPGPSVDERTLVGGDVMLRPHMAKSLRAAPMQSADMASAAVEADGPAVTFRVGGASRVPSDGSPHKVLVGEFPVEHRIDYVTAPKLAAEACRRATVTNTSPGPLLPGLGRLFTDSQMIGVTRVPLVAPRDEFELSLGVDDRIKVEREMVSGAAEKKVLQDRRVLSQGFRIEITNLTGRRQHVVVRDQLPISHDDRIRVRDPRLSPAPTDQDEMGRLEWELDIDDGVKREIGIRYTIEHPRDLRILNLPPVSG